MSSLNQNGQNNDWSTRAKVSTGFQSNQPLPSRARSVPSGIESNTVLLKGSSSASFLPRIGPTADINPELEDLVYSSSDEDNPIHSIFHSESSRFQRPLSGGAGRSGVVSSSVQERRGTSTYVRSRRNMLRATTTTPQQSFKKSISGTYLRRRPAVNDSSVVIEEEIDGDEDEDDNDDIAMKSSGNEKSTAVLSKEQTGARALKSHDSSVSSLITEQMTTEQINTLFNHDFNDIIGMLDHLKGNEKANRIKNMESMGDIDQQQQTAKKPKRNSLAIPKPNKFKPRVRIKDGIDLDDPPIGLLTFDTPFTERKKLRMTSKEFVEVALRDLKNNPVAMVKLSGDIVKHQKMKIQATKELRPDTEQNIVERNRQIPPDLPEHRLEQIHKSSIERDKRISLVRNRRTEVLQEYMKRKIIIAERERLKQERADKKRLDIAHKTALAERKLKWSFFIVFFNRFNHISRLILQEREIRKEKEQKQKIRNFISSKFMPHIWQRRTAHWNDAWDVFRKHWAFYRLWIDIKMKKEAIAIIKSFLDNARASLQFVRQTHAFRHRVLALQRRRKEVVAIREECLALNLMQYCIVEAKLLKGETLHSPASEFIPTPQFNPLSRRYEYPQRQFHSRPASSLSIASHLYVNSHDSTGLSVPDDMTTISNTTRTRSSFSRSVRLRRKSVVVPDEDDLSVLMEIEKEEIQPWHNADAIIVYHIPFEFKKQLMMRDIERRIEEYRLAIERHECELREFNAKANQMSYVHRATDILKGSGHRQNSKENTTDNEAKETQPDHKSYVDKQGITHYRPSEPIVHMFLSEQEIATFVMEGFKYVQEIEEKAAEDIVAKFGGEDKQVEMEKENFAKHYRNSVEECYFFLRMRVPVLFGIHEPHLRVTAAELNIVNIAIREKRRLLAEENFKQRTLDEAAASRASAAAARLSGSKESSSRRTKKT